MIVVPCDERTLIVVICHGSITHLLDRTAFSPFGAILVLLYVSSQSFSQLPTLASVSAHFKYSSSSLPKLSAFLTFVLLKTLNRLLTRLVVNNGIKYYARDRPVWSLTKGESGKDIVLITGGSAGIGKDMVEILSKKSGSVVVLDLAEPTYAASE